MSSLASQIGSHRRSVAALGVVASAILVAVLLNSIEPNSEGDRDFDRRSLVPSPRILPVKVQPDPFKLDDDFVEGRWNTLLHQEPRKLVWPEDGNTKMFFDETRLEVMLHCPNVGYVVIGETEAPEYKLSIRMERSDWHGPAGVFFGYKSAPWDDASRADQCLRVTVVGERGQQAYEHRLEIDGVAFIPGRFSIPSISYRAILSKPIAGPDEGDHLLELHIASNHLVKVAWDGQIITQFQRERAEIVGWVQETEQLTADGGYGLCSITGDTTFRDVRINLIRGKKDP